MSEKRGRREPEGEGGLHYPGNSAPMAFEIQLREKRSQPMPFELVPRVKSRASRPKENEPNQEEYRKQNRDRIMNYVR